MSTDKYDGGEFKSVDSVADCWLQETLPLTSPVTLGKMLPVSAPRFCHLSDEDDNDKSTYHGGNVLQIK